MTIPAWKIESMARDLSLMAERIKEVAGRANRDGDPFASKLFEMAREIEGRVVAIESRFKHEHKRKEKSK